MQHLDRGMEPPNDPPDTEFDGDEYLKWVANRFTPQDVFGLDVFEKPSIEFYIWMEKNNYEKTGPYYCNESPIAGKQTLFNLSELYQDYLKDTTR